MPTTSNTVVAQPTGAVAHHQLSPLAITDPFWTYFSTFQDADHAFLLDSALASEKLGEHSFMGCDPSLVLSIQRSSASDQSTIAVIEVERFKTAGGQRLAKPSIRRFTADAFTEIRALLAEYAAPIDPSIWQRFPLLGGAVGYFGYEAGQLIEKIADSKKDEQPHVPDIYFAFYDTILCHCHTTNATYVSAIGRGQNDEAAQRDAEASRAMLERRIAAEQQLEAIAESIPIDATAVQAVNIQTSACFDESAYCEAVRQIKQHIYAGDIYQACMTQQFQSPLDGGDAWKLYCELRLINPAPFACFLKAPTFSVVSASPERYLRVDADGNAESRPIKGTRPRGTTPEADAALRDELSHSVKDQSENVMIVDLVRNDFGRVCEFGSIHVAELMTIEPYATVFQMVSTIRGRLAQSNDALDLVRASFPGGSMTGAPKIEAMKILDALEPVPRGIYAGAIGYLDYGGAIDLSIVIRSFVIEDGQCYYGAGGAVVADSDPREEYLESLDKIRALQTALASVKA